MAMNKQLKACGIVNQRGVALIMALIFLVVLTILGVSVFGTTTAEQKMARNFSDNNIAFAAADAALRAAEIRITGYYTNPATPVSPFDFDGTCTNGLCDSTVAQPVYQTYPMAAAPSVAIGTNETGCTATGSSATCTPTIATSVAQQPDYLIEQISWAPPGESTTGPTSKPAYRITGSGFGRSATSQVLLQEIFVP